MSDHVDFVLAQWRAALPETPVDDMAVVSRLFRLAVVATREVDATFKQHGLNQGEFDVLATVYRSGAPYRLTPQRLIDALLLSSGAMTNRLDRLTSAGWIVREPNPDDRRSLFVTLTDAGRDKTDAVLHDYLAALARLTAPLDGPQHAQLAHLLKTLLTDHDSRAKGGITA
ncbi:MarR family winged helix-turn-helix transcriptional regulator [Schauerella aestuarii]|uniref:MarR family winged helix-turn-helix transcriptional regulator n=1 Tax=Schauerella aestuarii TaxID=2511204 RepID=UPI00136CC205|nr:MarR family transcriptional regulator [Achromobacter aestuarii]MYZ45915.1 MarR family transcriptional regulator [Achromobacter aestuarii]